MPWPFNLRDSDTDISVKVSTYGELVVGKLAYSTPYYVSVGISNTEYEVVQGLPNKCFVITDMLIASDKTFATSTASETILVYQADPSDITANLATVVKLDLLRNDRFAATGLNIITGITKSIIAIAPTSTTVDITIAGYYVPQ